MGTGRPPGGHWQRCLGGHWGSLGKVLWTLAQGCVNSRNVYLRSKMLLLLLLLLLSAAMLRLPLMLWGLLLLLLVVAGRCC